MDVVVAVSAPARPRRRSPRWTRRSAAAARLVTVGAPGSSLSARADDGRARAPPGDARGRMPRANLWGLAAPVLLVARRARAWLRSPAELADARRPARRDQRALRPGRRVLANPAKQLALQLAGSLPVRLGRAATSRRSRRAASAPARGEREVPGGDRRARRGAPQPGRRARRPLRRAGRVARRTSSATRRGPGAPGCRAAPAAAPRHRGASSRSAGGADATVGLAERYGVAVDVLSAEGEHPVTRLASLVAPLDFASVYLALLRASTPRRSSRSSR